jgi:hypothetical protein
MKISQADVVALFLACGVDTADKWDAAKLRAKVAGGMKKYREDDVPIKDAKLADLFDEVVRAQAAGEEIEMAEETGAADPKKKGKPKVAPKKKKGKPTAAVSKKATSEPKTNPKKGKPKKETKPAKEHSGAWSPDSGKPLPLSDRGPGITKYIIQCLQEAGSGKLDDDGVPRGLTKEELVKKLASKFRDHDPVKLASTVSNQVPSRLRIVRHLYAQRNPNTRGFYMEGDGTKKPKEKAVKKAAA